jgi:DNA-binding GntR family transcriptional regulator
MPVIPVGRGVELTAERASDKFFDAIRERDVASVRTAMARHLEIGYGVSQFSESGYEGDFGGSKRGN